MKSHTTLVPARTLILVLLIVVMVAGSTAAFADEAPGGDALAGPAAAPNPPQISIEKASSSIALLWQHTDYPRTTAYQVWRSEDPLFDPNAGQGVKIDEYTFPGTLYGQGTDFRYVDNGSCGKYTAPSSAPNTCRYPQSPTVTVLGDVAHNYFWAVRAGNTDGEYDFDNRVGEFDFRLVPGS
jgi:hypothetical protein